MRKRTVWFLACMAALSLTACGKDSGQTAGTQKDTSSKTEENKEADSSTNGEENSAAGDSVTGEAVSSGDSSTNGEGNGTESGETQENNNQVLVVYFSVPEDVDTSGIDAVAGASVVVRDGKVLGNTEYVAELIQQTVGGDLFQIETAKDYPLDHDKLVDQAADEKADEERPKLTSHVENFEKYKTVVLCFPNWWADMPMPVYTFLEEYDFKGKTVIPVVTHGGSGLSSTVGTLSKMLSGAQVSNKALSISRNHVADCEKEVTEWAEGLGLK